jgi:hypothetical protein
MALGGTRRSMPAGWRAGLAMAGALAVGVWLGVAVGLATRPRRDQPTGPPAYAGPADAGGSDEQGERSEP